MSDSGERPLGSDNCDAAGSEDEITRGLSDTNSQQRQLHQLHEAVDQGNFQLIHQILANGIDLEQTNAAGSKPLYLAVELGSPDIVALLLQAGADVESFNASSQECSTALQRAVDGDRMEIAELLLKHGADVNSIDPRGRTPLLTAIKNRTPEMVELLLRYGADKEATDRSGSTVFVLAQGSEQITSLLQEPQLLQGPLPVRRQAPQKRLLFKKSFRAPIHDRDKMIALHGFRATVVDFFISNESETRLEQSISVYKLLYGFQEVMEAPQGSVLKGKRRDFRWYHLPANNVKWVEDLIQNRLLKSQILSPDFKSAAGLTGSHDRHQHTPTNPSAHMRSTSFSFNISPSGEEVAYDQIAAFIPYLHFETQSSFNVVSIMINDILQTGARILKSNSMTNAADPGDHTQWSALDSKSLYGHLIRGYLTPDSLGEAGALQTRRTLDQYFYTYLDTRNRDRDQVVYRHMRDIMHSQEPKLFMVDQIWIWIIDQDTIITCVPTSIGDISMDDVSIRLTPPDQVHPSMPQGIRRHHIVRDHSKIGRISRPKQRTRQWVYSTPIGGAQPTQETQELPGDDEQGGRNQQNQRPLNIQHNISRYLRRAIRAQIKTPHELASLIIYHCTNVFADHDIPAEYQFFDFFEQSIGRVSDRVAHLLKLFQKATIESFHDVEKQLNILKEAKLLVEIEDIHDELIILRMVLKDQKTVTTELGKLLDSEQNQQSNPRTRRPSVKEDQLLENHLQRIENMEKMTQKTAKTLRSLLDLKQKQASIAGALSSVSYAKQSAEQAEETARQGRTLTLFTVVTIVFLPLSFLAAFFAINIDVFPVDADGKLSLDYVLQYLLGVSAGLSVPFILIAFNQDRFAGWIARIRPQSNTAYVLLATLLSLAVILTAVWTSLLDSTVKVGATIGTVLISLFGVVAIGIYRLVHPKIQPDTLASGSASVVGH
ncbi:hypothetical protein F4679DRAFT_485269 [Xylaria curta]|nr:hypothetical protein F4679DRAFT_485269 [Xylaria curta]